MCAGGGITGALYEVGALAALDRLLDRSVVDHDLYVGVSGGAFVAAPLAGGVAPAEIYEDAATSPGHPGTSPSPSRARRR